MELYMRKAKLSIADRFSVTDEHNKDVFHAEGQVISIGNKVKLTDSEGREAAVISEKKMGPNKKYTIDAPGHGEIEVIKREALRNEAEFAVKGLNWEVKGDFRKNDYKVMKALRTVAHVTPKRAALVETMKIQILDPSEAALAVAVIVACELAMD